MLTHKQTLIGPVSALGLIAKPPQLPMAKVNTVAIY